MPRCEACGGTIKGMTGSLRPRDKCDCPRPYCDNSSNTTLGDFGGESA